MEEIIYFLIVDQIDESPLETDPILLFIFRSITKFSVPILENQSTYMYQELMILILLLKLLIFIMMDIQLYFQIPSFTMRWRENWFNKTLMIPGKIYEIEISLWSTCYVFNKGHSLRVAISSSNFPR